MLKDIIDNLNFSGAEHYFPLWNGFNIAQHFLTVGISLTTLMRPFLEDIIKLPESTLNILSIGGRDCIELPVLVDWFTKYPTKNLNFVMVDIDPNAITGCQILYNNYMHRNISFICADANYLPFSQSYQGIVMRHPKFWNTDGKLILPSTHIVKILPHYLCANGKIFASFYNMGEKDYFENCANNLFLTRQFHITHHKEGSYIFPAPHPRMTDLIFDQYTAMLL